MPVGPCFLVLGLRGLDRKKRNRSGWPNRSHIVGRNALRILRKLQPNQCETIKKSTKSSKKSPRKRISGGFGAPGRLRDAQPRSKDPAEREKRSDSERFFCPFWDPPAPQRASISVAYGNIPAPGLGKVRVRTKICARLGCKRQSAGDSRIGVPKNQIFH